MAITKTIEIGQIEIVGLHKHVQGRTATVIKEDGTEISRKFHRHVLHPGKIDESDNWIDEDISGEDSSVQGIANAVWTQSVKDAFKAHLIAHKS